MQTVNSIDREKEYLINALSKVGIQIHFDEKERLVYLDNFVMRYLSKTAVVQTLTSLLLELQYYFQTNSEHPFIVDVGSESGCSILFFKILYPNAKIIAFEPHPVAYRIIQENIAANRFRNVTLVNAAVAGRTGEAFLYGDADYVEGECNTLGCSIVEAWGMQRPTCSAMPTRLVKLSDYIHEKVDFLKLDAEGAEYEILEDLKQQDKFRLICQFIMEVHQWDEVSREGLIETLKQAGFIDLLIDDKLISLACPVPNRRWIQERNIKLSLISGRKPLDIFDRQPSSELELLKKLFRLNQISLQQKNDVLASVLENVPAGVYWKDLDFTYQGYNNFAMEQFYQYHFLPEEPLMGKTDYDLFPKSLADGYRFNDQQVIFQHKQIQEEIKLEKGKDSGYQLSSKRPLYNKIGEIIGLVGVTVDLTEHYQLLELRRNNQLQQIKLTEQANYQKMIKQLAHDIRSPLTNLLLMLESSASALDEDKRLVMQKTVREIGLLANGLLESNVKQLDKHHESTPLILGILLEDWFQESKYKYSYYPIDFVFKAESGVTVLFIQGNKLALKRAFINLFNNAVESIDKKQGKVVVELKVVDKNWIELSIQDNGSGMDVNLLEDIRQQRQVVSRKENGHGLGYAQVYEVVNQHKGKLTVESIVSEGSKIRLCFPIVKVPDWVVRSVEIRDKDQLVIISKTQELFSNWSHRLRQLGWPNVKAMHHFYDYQEALDYISTLRNRQNLLIFTDWSLMNEQPQGNNLLGLDHLCRKSYLIANISKDFLTVEGRGSFLVIGYEYANSIPFVRVE